MVRVARASVEGQATAGDGCKPFRRSEKGDVYGHDLGDTGCRTIAFRDPCFSRCEARRLMLELRTARSMTQMLTLLCLSLVFLVDVSVGGQRGTPGALLEDPELAWLAPPTATMSLQTLSATTGMELGTTR